MENNLTVVEQNTQVVTQEQGYVNLIDKVISQGGSIESLEKMMDLQDRYEKKIAKSKLEKAFSKFQSNSIAIEKNGYVKYADFNYAKLEDIQDAIRKPLTDAGLSYYFDHSEADNKITVKCTLSHIDGGSRSTELTSAINAQTIKDPLKAKMATISYLKRYTLTSILGITIGGEDDDAQSVGSVEPVLYNAKEKFEHCQWIEKAIDDTGVDIKKILDFANVNDIYEIPDSLIVQIKNKLQASLDKKAK